VTNNSRASRADYKAKIQKFGIRAEKEEVYSSSYAAASYLKSLNFSKKVYVVGGQGIGDELKEVGIPYRGIEEHAKFISNVDEAAKIEVDTEVQ
jgi:ribonucleotide monophosphatase NagD (HAD superfamily)